MQVTISDTVPDGWDTYVSRSPGSTAWHGASAVAIGNIAFGLPTYWLAARDAQGNLRGVLPLVEQSSLAFGRFLTSLPFANYGGLLADDTQAVQALASEAGVLGRARGVRHVELRHSGEGPGLDWPCRLDKVSMILELPDSEEALAKQLGAKLRSQIRRAEREDPQVEWGGAELLPEFHEVFSVTMRDLGTPSYPLVFFRVALESLAGRARVLVIRTGGVARAAAIVVRHPSRLEVPWAAAGEEAKRCALNMRMYWEMLRYALQDRAPAFDFGRSTVDSGTYRFKGQWGARPLQLRWHYWLPDGGELPMLNPHNPKFALAAAVWRKLPLAVAKRLGPLVVRNLP